jgi:hypothetical protein
VIFEGVDSLLEAGGTDLGTTGWRAIGATDVDRYAAAIGGEAPGDDGVVPPLMLLALTNEFLPDLLQVRGATSGVNYGTATVRFGEPVHPGDRLRARAELTNVAEVPGGVQTEVWIQLEVDGSSDTACVVESLSRWLR